jgi:SAM-dependent methyltransferase
MEEIVAGAIAAARPEPGLRWLDIGCGRGDLLRRIRD